MVSLSYLHCNGNRSVFSIAFLFIVPLSYLCHISRVDDAPATKKQRRGNVVPSGLLCGWDSAPVSSVKAATMGSENDNSVRYGGMVGDSEDDVIERAAIILGNKSLKKKNLVSNVLSSQFFFLLSRSSILAFCYQDNRIKANSTSYKESSSRWSTQMEARTPSRRRISPVYEGCSTGSQD